MKYKIHSAKENLNPYLDKLEDYNFEIASKFEDKVQEIEIEIKKEKLYDLLEVIEYPVLVDLSGFLVIRDGRF